MTQSQLLVLLTLSAKPTAEIPAFVDNSDISDLQAEGFVTSSSASPKIDLHLTDKAKNLIKVVMATADTCERASKFHKSSEDAIANAIQQTSDFVTHVKKFWDKKDPAQ